MKPHFFPQLKHPDSIVEKNPHSDEARPKGTTLADVYYVCICVRVRIMQWQAFRGFQSTFSLAQKYMNRSLTSFSESKKHISLSYAFKHPFIGAHLQSVTIFQELYAYISE